MISFESRCVLTGHLTPPGNNPLFTNNNKVKYLSESKWPVKAYDPETHFAMCELWHWPLRYKTQVKAMVELCKVMSRSNMTVRINESSKDISFVCTVTLASVIWPGVKVMSCFGHGQQLCEILSRSILAVRNYGRIRISDMCALWYWPWRYYPVLMKWHTLGSWTTIVWYIIQIQHSSEELWPGHRDPGNMTLGQGQNTPLGRGLQVCKIWFNIAVRSYVPGTKVWYVCTVTLTLVIWPCLRPYHTLGSWTAIDWNIIQIQHGN